MPRYDNSGAAVIAEGADGQVTVTPSATATRRGRRHLAGLLRIVGFFLLVGITAFALDATVSSGLRSIRTSKYGSLNRVMNGEVNADVVINGSSRALTHYDPRLITQATGWSAYNLGMNGVQIDVQLAMLKTYLRHNTKPKLVIQNLESFTFEPTRVGEIYDPGLYIPYLGDDTLYDSLVRIDPAVWKWRHIPLYGYVVEDMRFTWLFGLAAHLGFQGREDYFLGFNPRHLAWTDDFSHFRAAVQEGVRYRIEPRAVDALTELLTLCRNQGIKVILVYSPEYYDMQRLELNRADIFREFATLASRFNVPLWDYSDSALCRNQDNFYNSQHLNAEGAAQFSADIARRLWQQQAETGSVSATSAP